MAKRLTREQKSEQALIDIINQMFIIAGHNVTVRFGKEIRFDDLIQEHEAKYGKLRKYSAQASQQDLDNFHDSWDSVPQDYALYHKITSRIQQALEDLNAIAVTK